MSSVTSTNDEYDGNVNNIDDDNVDNDNSDNDKNNIISTSIILRAAEYLSTAEQVIRILCPKELEGFEGFSVIPRQIHFI